MAAAAAASTLKMVAAICVVMLLVQSSLSLGYQPALGGGAAGLACPSAETECRAKCRLTCESTSQELCGTICTVPITPLGSTCVNNLLGACFDYCLSNCQIPQRP